MNAAERAHIAKVLLTAADTLEQGGEPVEAAKKLSKKKAEDMVEKAFYRAVTKPINIMDIDTVFKAGHAALAQDPSGATLEKALKDAAAKL